MKFYAFMQDGKTVDWVWPPSADAPMLDPQPTPVEVFGEDQGSHLVECGAEVAHGWTYDGKTFAAPVVVVPPVSVRAAAGAALVHVLDKTTKVSPRDLAYVAGLSAAREDMASIVRIAGVDGSTPKDWFDLALGGAA